MEKQTIDYIFTNVHEDFLLDKERFENVILANQKRLLWSDSLNLEIIKATSYLIR
jgi:hypothetical protein